MEIVDLPVKTCNVYGDRKQFRPDNDFVYVQPPRPRLSVYRQPYRCRTTRMQTGTTYTGSYMKPDIPVKGKNEISPACRPKVYGKFDMNTINKMSYQWPNAERPKTCYPQSRLGCGKSPMETTTVHSSSYMNPGTVKTKSAKHCRVIRPVTAPMESTTIARESYQHPGPPTKRSNMTNSWKNQRNWKLSVTPDYETIQRLSYQKNAIGDRKIPYSRKNRANVSAKIDCQTTYNMSYMIPGYFIRLKN